MAHIYQRGRGYWVKFRNPKTRLEVRASLETRDESQARCRLRKLELLCALREPAVVLTELPTDLENLFETNRVATAIEPPKPGPTGATDTALEPLSVEAAVGAYYKLIKSKNTGSTVANKLSILRKAFGTDLVTRATGVVPKRAEHRAGLLNVPTMDELTVDVIQDFIEREAEATKTRRHYRELFHHLFEECFKRHLMTPKSWHTPNPMSALPCYSTKNNLVEYLNQNEIDAQEQALDGHPVFKMAVITMIEAGLRRSELLWLTKDSIDPALEFLSVVNRVDDADLESSLKTGTPLSHDLSATAGSTQILLADRGGSLAFPQSARQAVEQGQLLETTPPSERSCRNQSGPPDLPPHLRYPSSDGR